MGMEHGEYSGLMYADIEWKTEDGQVFFSMKKKSDWGPTYYVFEKNLDVLPEEERAKFEEGFIEIARMAGIIGIRLYDSREIMDAVQSKMRELMDSTDWEKAEKEAETSKENVLVKDIKISLFDHGTGEIEGLTIGISVPSKSEKERIKEEIITTRPPKGPL